MADDCFVAEGVVLDARGGLRIGAHTSINSAVQIWTAQHDVRSEDFEYVARPVEVGDHCWISARSTVLPGVVVGRGTVVAAGAVVSASLPAWTLCGGVPAKPIAERPMVDGYVLDASRNKVWWW